MFSSPKLRDTTIELACQNMVMAEKLDEHGLAMYMRMLTGISDDELARQLVGSKMLLDRHYAQVVSAGRN